VVACRQFIQGLLLAYHLCFSPVTQAICSSIMVEYTYTEFAVEFFNHGHQKVYRYGDEVYIPRCREYMAPACFRFSLGSGWLKNSRDKA